MLCLTAPPDVTSTRLDRFWIRVGLGLYAVLRATNALRASKWQEGGSEQHGRAWTCLWAGLTEAVRGAPHLQPLLTPWMEASEEPLRGNKRNLEQEEERQRETSAQS